MQDLSKFIPFKAELTAVSLPEKFTYPFYYTPHPLAITATEELQEYIELQDWNHNFGLDPEAEGLEIGKMFGVLVVESSEGEIGYLAAFSGKLANSNHHKYFVPPVFDMLTEGSFFLEGELEINAINARIKDLETNERYIKISQELLDMQQKLKCEESELREEMRIAKAYRKQQRQKNESILSAFEFKNRSEERRV